MLIKNGIIFDFFNKINGVKKDILIKNSKIVKIADKINDNEEKIIDAKNLYIIPGIIDIHTHLRTPGYEYKEDIISGTKSAAKGGITTILTMPNTNPPIDNPEIISFLKNKIFQEAIINVLISSSMTINRKGQEIVNIMENNNAGAIAFSDDGNAIQNRELLISLCRKIKEFNLKTLLIEHPEFEEFAKMENRIISPISYGIMEKRLGIKGQSAESESLDILTLGIIAGYYNINVHFTHISTEKSIDAIKYLKKFYPEHITCDCTPHHLILNENNILNNEHIDTNKKINPPLRPESDRIALEKGIIDGTIDCIASDHAPHSEDEKNKNIFEAPFGTIGFETLLPSIYTFFVKTKKISMLRMVELLSYNPSKILNLNSKGIINQNYDADITIFDPNESFIYEKNIILSKSKNSAFLNMKFYGNVKFTICNGKTIYPF